MSCGPTMRSVQSPGSVDARSAANAMHASIRSSMPFSRAILPTKSTVEGRHADMPYPIDDFLVGKVLVSPRDDRYLVPCRPVDAGEQQMNLLDRSAKNGRDRHERTERQGDAHRRLTRPSLHTTPRAQD